jgi:hypothetical protein
MPLPTINLTLKASPVILNLETDTSIEFDGVDPIVTTELSSGYSVETPYASIGALVSFQGGEPETRSYTFYLDRYTKRQDIRPASVMLKSLLTPGKNLVPPLVAIQMGDHIVSPCIIRSLQLSEGGFLSGIPTRLKATLNLLIVPSSAIV